MKKLLFAALALVSLHAVSNAQSTTAKKEATKHKTTAVNSAAPVVEKTNATSKTKMVTPVVAKGPEKPAADVKTAASASTEKKKVTGTLKNKKKKKTNSDTGIKKNTKKGS